MACHIPNGTLLFAKLCKREDPLDLLARGGVDIEFAAVAAVAARWRRRVDSVAFRDDSFRASVSDASNGVGSDSMGERVGKGSGLSSGVCEAIAEALLVEMAANSDVLL